MTVFDHSGGEFVLVPAACIGRQRVAIVGDRRVDAVQQHPRAMTQIIADGVRAAEFRETDERIAVLTVIGMCNWAAWWYRPGRDPEPKAVAKTIGLLFDAIAEVSGRLIAAAC